MNSAKKLKRYRVSTPCTGLMVEDTEGALVYFEDVESELESKDKEMDELKVKLKGSILSTMLNECSEERKQLLKEIEELKAGCDIWIQKCDQQFERIKELKKLTGHFPDGMGDYEWKIVENFNSKNHLIAEQQKRITQLEEEVISWNNAMLQGKAFQVDRVKCKERINELLTKQDNG